MYAKLQKIISFSLFLISIGLSSLCFDAGLNKLLVTLPAYSPRSKQIVQQNIQYTARELGVTGTTTKFPSSLNAKAACLIDADSGMVLFAKNADEKLPMASTTKIMTALIALESSDLSDTITFSAHAASMPDVQLNAMSGEQFTLRDLLYSLLLESHNDTAVAIAEHVSGSTEAFADKMNEKAVELGLSSTHFVTPNGLDADEHYTTAKELCLIASYALQNQTFCKIIRTPAHSFANRTNTKQYHVTNHDAFLTNYAGAIGIKTGFTGNAGYCFCGAAKRGDITLISSVLACGWPPHKTYKWTDTKKLMDYGFTNYKLVRLTETPMLQKIPVHGGRSNIMQPRRSVPARDTKLLMTSADTLRICYELPHSLKAPIRSGDIIGYENYYLNDTLLQSIPIGILFKNKRSRCTLCCTTSLSALLYHCNFRMIFFRIGDRRCNAIIY